MNVPRVHAARSAVVAVVAALAAGIAACDTGLPDDTLQPANGSLFTHPATAAAGGQLGEPPTREQLLARLYGLRGETLGGIDPPLTFNRGPHRDVNTCVRPTRLTSGRWVEPLGEQWLCTRLR